MRGLHIVCLGILFLAACTPQPAEISSETAVSQSPPPTAAAVTATAVPPTTSPIPVSVPTATPLTLPASTATRPATTPTSNPTMMPTKVLPNAVFTNVLAAKAEEPNSPMIEPSGIAITEKVQVVNGLIYLIRGHELLVLDPANLEEPLGRLAFGMRFGDDIAEMVEHYYFATLGLVVTEDGFAYVTDDQLYIVDVRDPANMQIVGTTSGLRPHLLVRDGIAYSSNSLDLQIANVANTSQPEFLVEFPVFETGDFGTYLVDNALATIAGGRILIYAGQSRGVIMLDVTDPANIVRLPGLPDFWTAAISVVGSQLYVQASGEQMASLPADGLFLFDISDPERPYLISDALPDLDISTLLLTEDGRFYTTNGNLGSDQEHTLVWGTVTADGVLQLQGEASLPGIKKSLDSSLALVEDRLLLGGPGGVYIIALKDLPTMTDP